jgi:hypothetical protein
MSLKALDDLINLLELSLSSSSSSSTSSLSLSSTLEELATITLSKYKKEHIREQSHLQKRRRQATQSPLLQSPLSALLKPFQPNPFSDILFDGEQVLDSNPSTSSTSSSTPSSSSSIPSPFSSTPSSSSSSATLPTTILPTTILPTAIPTLRDQQTILRSICDHLLHSGELKVSKLVSDKLLLEQIEVINFQKKASIFSNIYKHYTLISNGDAILSIEYLQKHKDDAEAIIGTEAFIDLALNLYALHVCKILCQGFVGILRNDDDEIEQVYISDSSQRVGIAMAYIYETIQPFEFSSTTCTTHQNDSSMTNRLVAACIYTRNAQINASSVLDCLLLSPYSNLFHSSFAIKISKTFKSLHCKLYNVIEESTLERTLRAGDVAIEPLTTLAKSGKWPLCDDSIDSLLPVTIELDSNLISHNIFVCPVSRLEETKGRVLKCGHIIGCSAFLSLSSFSSFRNTSSGGFKCPICPQLGCKESESLLIDFGKCFNSGEEKEEEDEDDEILLDEGEGVAPLYNEREE